MSDLGDLCLPLQDVLPGFYVYLQILLKSCTDDEEAKNLASGYEMLVDKDTMGERFKFFALLQKDIKDYIPSGFVDPTQSYPHTCVPTDKSPEEPPKTDLQDS